MYEYARDVFWRKMGGDNTLAIHTYSDFIRSGCRAEGHHLTPPTPHPTTGSGPRGLPISSCKVQSRPVLSGLKVLQATFIESRLAFSNILIRAISEVCLNSLSLFV